MGDHGCIREGGHGGIVSPVILIRGLLEVQRTFITSDFEVSPECNLYLNQRSFVRGIIGGRVYGHKDLQKNSPSTSHLNIHLTSLTKSH